MRIWYVYEQNAHDDLSSGARGLNFGLSLCLHPYFVYANGQGFCETVHMRRLISTFAGHLISIKKRFLAHKAATPAYTMLLSKESYSFKPNFK